MRNLCASREGYGRRSPGLLRRPALILIHYALLAHCAYAAETVTIELSGEILPRCEVSSLENTVDLGLLNMAGEREIHFDFHCNESFSYKLSSHHGGLKHSAAAQSDAAGFSSLLPYTIDINIPTDDGAIIDRCESIHLKAGSQGCGMQTSGGSTAIGKTATLVIRWHPDATPVAGIYQDVLRLTLEPDL